jgi:hypothetical protein
MHYEKNPEHWFLLRPTWTRYEYQKLVHILPRPSHFFYKKKKRKTIVSIIANLIWNRKLHIRAKRENARRRIKKPRVNFKRAIENVRGVLKSVQGTKGKGLWVWCLQFTHFALVSRASHSHLETRRVRLVVSLGKCTMSSRIFKLLSAYLKYLSYIV